MNKEEFVQDCIKKVKDARIDDQYLSYIGFDSRKTKGCCPVHVGNNKNGFSYTDKKGYRQYSCWTKGCIGTGVDIIHLCKVKENLSNEYEAAKYLANMFNIELPKIKRTKEDIEKFKEAKRQQQIQNKNKFKIDRAIADAETIDRKFLISGLNAENTADMEIINHADYKANEKYYIDKYISEENLSIVNLLLDNRDSLLIAPPGSGKTYEIIQTCKRFNIKSIFVLPLASNVEQTANTYDLYCAYDKLDLIEALEKSENIVVCTWDKLQQLKNCGISEYKIILDEVHQIYTDLYREKAIDNMLNIINRAKSRLDVTATPTMLDFSEYEHIVEFIQKNKTNKDIKLYDNVDTKTILDIVNNPKNKSMVLINNKTILNMLADSTAQKHDVISADTKYTSKLYKLLMEESTMGDYRTLYHTTTLLASYNIKDNNITDIIVVADRELKNISNIIQDIARPRRVDNIRVHIFGKFKDECTTVSVNWLIKKEQLKWQKVADLYNESIYDEFTTFKLDVTASDPGGSYIYYDKETNQYMVDKVKIRAEIYNQYYNSRSIENFAALLSEYLDLEADTIEFISGVQEQQVELIKESAKASKEAKKEALEELEKYKDKLVGYKDIVKGSVNYKLYNYMRDNELNEDELLEVYNNNNIAVSIEKVTDTLDLYSEYVLDYNYSYDLSWKLAKMHHNTRTHKFINPVKNIIYSKIKEMYPGEIIDTIDNRVYDYIVENIKPGMRYTTDHIELLSMDLINKFKDNRKYNTTNTRKLLNEIFSITNKQFRKNTSVSLVGFNFYINKEFTGDTFDKLTRVYTIENLISIDDIKKELHLSSSDKSIELTIDKKVKKINGEYEANKQVEQDLIKEIFNIC